MKTLAIIVISLAVAATPVLACPHEDAPAGNAPKTAEKDRTDKKADTKAKPSDKQADPKTAKPAESTDKAKDATGKKSDKVSSK
jgi:hypothetical protein